MNPEIYARFIPHILNDVAERRTDSDQYLPRGRRRWIRIRGQRNRVPVRGDHICYQCEEFHGSDAEFRLTMAMAAAELIEKERLGRSWGSNTKASLHVAEVLLNSGCERLKRRYLKPHRRKGNRAKDATSCAFSEPPFLSLAATIRRQVRRYRTENPDWRRDFDSEVATFRSGHFRDPEWYNEVENRYVRWLSDFEKRQEFEWSQAAKVVAMARFYNEQNRFDQAVAVYRKAILIARNALMNEAFRQAVLRWLRKSVKACLRNTRVVPDPGYLGLRASSP